MSTAPTERFSARAPYYHQHRPRYPQALIDLLVEKIGLTAEHVIADIGAGTSLSSELFLKNGNTVYAVEPNADMRAIALTHYGGNPKFVAVPARAEATTLPDQGVDVIIVGQAFHWFDQAAAKAEFRRILKPDGYVVLMWNMRSEKGSPFLEAYNAFVREFDTDGSSGKPKGTDDEAAALKAFYGEAGYAMQAIDNVQSVNFDGLRGRALSSSYMPLPGHARFDAMIAQLHNLFDAFQRNGTVDVAYTTEVYWGRLG